MLPFFVVDFRPHRKDIVDPIRTGSKNLRRLYHGIPFGIGFILQGDLLERGGYARYDIQWELEQERKDFTCNRIYLSFRVPCWSGYNCTLEQEVDNLRIVLQNLKAKSFRGWA